LSDTGPKKEHLVMDHLVSLTYREELTPNLDRFVDALMEGHILGERCPSCGRISVPGKGFCALCLVMTSADDQVEVADTGVVTAFTVVTPVRYYGQHETEPFVSANILLDGADAVLGNQRVSGISTADIRPGLRVRARWLAPEERSAAGISNRSGGADAAIECFEPTGEPDAAPEIWKEHIL
jgi:uncharacterized OB-fold protein